MYVGMHYTFSTTFKANSGWGFLDQLWNAWVV